MKTFISSLLALSVLASVAGAALAYPDASDAREFYDQREREGGGN